MLASAPSGASAREAPATWAGTIQQLGPGLIITAAIVGSGELIVTPKLGAQHGFSLLWFLLIGCFLKVFVQVELARLAVSEGTTTLDAMNGLPGPRLRVSWLVWVWLPMYFATIFQVGGIVGGVVAIFRQMGLELPLTVWTAIVSASCALLLATGRYTPVERASTLMVGLFTATTMVAVIAVQYTPYRISASELASGLSFTLPASFTVAFAAFGVTGVGASELIYYPYWCLEKGYARHVGPADGSEARLRRARGWLSVMRTDAWLSMIIYTGATAAFYLLGAAVLHGRGLEVTDEGLLATLSEMYEHTLGEWGAVTFLFGGFVVLYSTFFVATASNARLGVDVGRLLGLWRLERPGAHARAVQAACVLLPFASGIVFLLWPQPVALVLVGAVGQGLMLPFLAGAALYFRHRRVAPALRPGAAWTAALWIAAALMALVGLYQAASTLGML